MEIALRKCVALKEKRAKEESKEHTPKGRQGKRSQLTG